MAIFCDGFFLFLFIGQLNQTLNDDELKVSSYVTMF